MKSNRVIYKDNYNCKVYSDIMVFTTLLPIPTSGNQVDYNDEFKYLKKLRILNNLSGDDIKSLDVKPNDVIEGTI